MDLLEIPPVPASTLAILRLDPRDCEDRVRALWAGQGNEPALIAPLRELGRLADLALAHPMVSRLWLSRSRAPGFGFLMIARLSHDSGLGEGLVLAGEHRSHELLANPGAPAVSVAATADWAFAGAPAAVRAALDVLDGKAPGADTAALAPWLPALANDASLSFVVGLPALEREVSPPGPGKVTLVTAQAVVGAVDLGGDSFSGYVRFHSPVACDFVERFRRCAPEAIPQPTFVESSGEVDLDAVEISFGPVSWDRSSDEFQNSRLHTKRLFHGMNAVDWADGVRHGGNAAWMNFDVGGEPPSIFVNFAFRDRAAVEAFEKRELPAGFRLAPLRILEDDEPTFFLVLNAYQSSGGLVSGARAEWSVFVHDPEDDHPRFLVVQAAAANFSADPVNLLTHPEPVSHEYIDGRIVSHVGRKESEESEEQAYFTSRLCWPPSSERLVLLDREFVAANDLIHWGHGVADRTLYNASMHNRAAVRIPRAEVEVDDRSRWAEYLDPTPRHAYVYREALEIVISPWCNLDHPSIDAPSEHRKALVEFKDGFYPGMIRDIAEGAMRGEKDALTAYTVGTRAPSLWIHFPITDREGFVAATGVPGLAELCLLSGGDVGGPHLVLVVESVDGAPEGICARWATYVVGEAGRPSLQVLATLSEEVAVDPEYILRLPDRVEHELDAGIVRTRLASGEIEFASEIRLVDCSGGLWSRDAVESGDWITHAGGARDKVYYDGGMMEEAALVGLPEVAVMETPWNRFIDIEAARASVRTMVLRKACNPWRDLGVAGTGMPSAKERV